MILERPLPPRDPASVIMWRSSPVPIRWPPSASSIHFARGQFVIRHLGIDRTEQDLATVMAQGARPPDLVERHEAGRRHRLVFEELCLAVALHDAARNIVEQTHVRAPDQLPISFLSLERQAALRGNDVSLRAITLLPVSLPFRVSSGRRTHSSLLQALIADAVRAAAPLSMPGPHHSGLTARPCRAGQPALCVPRVISAWAEWFGP